MARLTPARVGEPRSCLRADDVGGNVGWQDSTADPTPDPSEARIANVRPSSMAEFWHPIGLAERPFHRRTRSQPQES